MQGVVNVTDCGCDGHGSCVVDASSGAQLCLCDSLWDGGNDYFDNRIVFSPIYGKWLSLSCSNPLVGMTVVWTILIVSGLRRVVSLIISLVSYYKHGTTPSPQGLLPKLKNLYTYPPYRFLLLALLLETPCIMASYILKLAALWGRPSGPQGVLGTDIAVTIVFLTGGQMRITFFSWLEALRFEKIARGNLFTLQQTKQMLCRFYVAQYFTAAAYFGCVVIPSYILLARDKSTGALASESNVIIIVRNIGVLMAILAGSGGLLLLGGLVQRTIKDISDAAGHGYKMDDVMNVLKGLEEIRKRSIASAAAGMLFYMLFSFPFGWEYQTFSVVAVLLMGDFAMNPANVFKPVRPASAMDAVGGSITIGDNTLGTS